jgi:hypothetical protein
MVLDYIIHLKKIAKPSSEKARRGELSVNSVKTYLAGVQSFLEANDSVKLEKIAKYCPEQVANNLSLFKRRDCKTFIGSRSQRPLSYFIDGFHWNEGRSYQIIKAKSPNKIAAREQSRISKHSY